MSYRAVRFPKTFACLVRSYAVPSCQCLCSWVLRSSVLFSAVLPVFVFLGLTQCRLASVYVPGSYAVPSCQCLCSWVLRSAVLPVFVFMGITQCRLTPCRLTQCRLTQCRLASVCVPGSSYSVPSCQCLCPWVLRSGLTQCRLASVFAVHQHHHCVKSLTIDNCLVPGLNPCVT